MSSRPALLLPCLTLAMRAADFAGEWNFDPERSRLDWLPAAPAALLKIETSGARVRCTACGQGGWDFATDGSKSVLAKAGVHTSIVTKWEGSALMINAIVSGPANYVIGDRWKLSRDGNALTILRQVQRGASESESTLVYRRAGTEAPAPRETAPGPEPARAPETAARPAAKAEPREFVLPPGTRIPMRLTGPVSTKTAHEGDRVYLETTFPIQADGVFVVPPGSQVIATVRFAERPGKVKGKGELMFWYDSIVLPNGVTKSLRVRLAGVEPGRGAVEDEGKIRGNSGKGSDAAKVGQTTSAGAGVGSAVGAATGRYGTGVAAGAAAGAAAGLARVFGGRGPDLELRKGETMEVVLEEPLRFIADEAGSGARP